MNADASLLEVHDLRVELKTRRGRAMVLNGVSFALAPGETLCVVGESGCGKSLTALALLGLVPQPPGRVAGGRIVFRGEELLGVGETRLRDVRGNRISMIFQEPMTSLNPVFPVGDQISEALRLHAGLGAAAARARSVELLRQVGIPAPERRIDEYPHQLSGGMRQRVMIAMALACRPDILIADEPTTALDVTVQAQIFDLLRELQRERGTAILLITHDMGAVAEMADRVVVMYAGRIVEEGRVDDVLERPGHPYTQGLIDCLPDLGVLAGAAGDEAAGGARRELPEIPGVVPSLWALASGCAFRDRCPHAMPRCAAEVPPMFAAPAADAAGGTMHRAACWLLDA